MRSLFLFLLSTLIFSCSSPKEDEYTVLSPDPFIGLNLPNTPFNYSDIDLPAHYTQNAFPPQAQFQRAAISFDNTPANNSVTNAGATLGRVLFYDEKLSANGTVSCASCHQAAFGFSDPERLSEGFEGERTRRHSMGLVNARFYFSGKFFWDERAASLEEQVLQPIQDEVEMGLTLNDLERIVSEQAYYPPLFEAAFGSETISSERIGLALAQFVRSLVSTTSKYDLARAEVANPMLDFPAFTAQENRGKTLFFRPIESSTGGAVNCAGCHVSEAFVGPIPNGPIGASSAINNGLDAVSTDDHGVFEATQNPNDRGKFKSPSLRNIGIRPPYMHDGRFATLEEVIEHYNSGIQDHPTLAPPLRDNNGNPVRLNLSEEDKAALVAFLHTLTDYNMLEDEKFSDPFQ